MDPVLDVVGVGNAIVDVIASVGDSFIGDHDLVKGAMTLVSAERSAELYDAMPPGVAASGGSAANTMAGVASFGGRAAFIGKVRDDQLGEVFIHDIRATGVSFGVPPAPDGPATARCLVQVTPDAERTMNTYLGTAALLGPPDVDTDLVASAGITYCEGYLWDVQVAKDAIRVAMAAAASAGRTVALALSDSYCVERHRDEWLDLIEDRVDVVFANEAEVCALHPADDFDSALRRTAAMAKTVAVTRGARGSVAVQGSESATVPAAEIPAVVDATGAGDLYAAGFLWGLSRGAPLIRCAGLGNLAAAEVISHVGARPKVALSQLAASAGLA
ncbi:MAG: adenosine kinase [Acidimicrobiaceae bacterium]|nr:adenosine kinase [Acidimicrobiaceae bacterium]MYE09866.1 adenosine kinase [Acidimicrobiaceae bacterium]MYI35746.1 adenosine kinase [Acidimicrobiaceae bacterium]